MILTLCTVFSYNTLPLVLTCEHIILKSADSQSEKSFMSRAGAQKNEKGYLLGKRSTTRQKNSSMSFRAILLPAEKNDRDATQKIKK